MKFRFIVIAVFSVFLSCKKKIVVPNTLKIAFNYLDTNWNDDHRDKFSTLESKELTPVYYGYAIEDDLQHNLLKNHDASLKLNAFFDSLGVLRPKDKSGLILNTYFNYLNNEDIELQNQVEAIKAYWQPIEDCKNAIKAKAIKNYTLFNVNDIVSIRLPVDEHNNAIDYDCPDNSWLFKEDKDLTITATLLGKSLAKDSLNASFNMKLLSKSKSDTEILYQEISNGDTFEISIFNSWKMTKEKYTDETKTNNL